MRVMQAKLYEKIPQFFSNGGGGAPGALARDPPLLPDGWNITGNSLTHWRVFFIMFYLIVINQVFIYIQKIYWFSSLYLTLKRYRMNKSKPDLNDYNKLKNAVSTGDVIAVKRLLKGGVNVNSSSLSQDWVRVFIMMIYIVHVGFWLQMKTVNFSLPLNYTLIITSIGFVRHFH